MDVQEGDGARTGLAAMVEALQRWWKLVGVEQGRRGKQSKGKRKRTATTVAGFIGRPRRKEATRSG